MDLQHTEPTGRKDEFLIALADDQRRAVLSYLRDSSGGSASVSELSDAVGGTIGPASNEDAVRLHHSTLPRLDAVGVVDFDARSGTVTYRGHDGLESLLAAVEEL